MDEVLTQDELKKIVGRNGSGACQDFECICYRWVDRIEVMDVYPQTACSFQDILDMGAQMLDRCESFSGCNAV